MYEQLFTIDKAAKPGSLPSMLRSSHRRSRVKASFRKLEEEPRLSANANSP